jgi:hypothetical protein
MPTTAPQSSKSSAELPRCRQDVAWCKSRPTVSPPQVIPITLWCDCRLLSRCSQASHKSSSRELNLTAYRILGLCHNVIGAFTPVLAKHSKSFSLVDCISVGVDRMQRNFEPMRKQVETWQRSELTDVTAKVVIYEAFVEGRLEAPKHLARNVHDLYFEPQHEEFRPRTIWSLSNAFTSAFKELDPIPQLKATAKLGGFLEARFSQSF